MYSHGEIIMVGASVLLGLGMTAVLLHWALENIGTVLAVILGVAVVMAVSWVVGKIWLKLFN